MKETLNLYITCIVNNILFSAIYPCLSTSPLTKRCLPYLSIRGIRVHFNMIRWILTRSTICRRRQNLDQIAPFPQDFHHIIPLHHPINLIRIFILVSNLMLNSSPSLWSRILITSSTIRFTFQTRWSMIEFHIANESWTPSMADKSERWDMTRLFTTLTTLTWIWACTMMTVNRNERFPTSRNLCLINWILRGNWQEDIF